MTSKNIMQQWSILMVPFPFTDKLAVKKRPVIVLNTESFAKQEHHYHLLMVATAKNSHWLTDIPIQHIDNTGLKVPSVMRFKIVTLHKDLIIKKVGLLHKEDVANLYTQLTQIWSI